MKTLISLVLGLSAVQAEDAPKFTPRFIVPAKLEQFPRMILDKVAEPEALRELADKIEGTQTADATAVIVTERPFSLDDEASKVLSEAFTANEEPAKEIFKSMPLIGPQRVFALMNLDGKFGAIILDYRGAVIITKVNWIGDSHIQPDRSWSRSVASHELNDILDLASKRPANETPFQAWMDGDRHHKLADSLTPKDNKQNKLEQDDP